MLELLLNELREEGIKVDGYGDEYYLSRMYGQYTIYIGEVDGGFELGTYKDIRNEDISNLKTVKTIKAVKTYLKRFL